MHHMAVKSILVLYLGHRGAGPEYAYEMTKGLIENGIIVYAIISSTSDNVGLWDNLRLNKLVKVDTPEGYRDAVWKTIFHFHKILKKIKKEFRYIRPDVCYTPMGHSWDGPILKYFQGKGCKVVTTIHDVILHQGENGLKQLPMFLYDKIFNRQKVDKAVILSEAFRTYMEETRGFKSENVIVIPHGTFSNYDINKIGIPNPISEYNFLFFGRIVKYKGIGLLAKAYKKLSEEFDNVSLRIIGSGDLTEHEETLNQCKNLRIENRYVDASEIQDFFMMPKTIVVLPYIDASQSGVIPIAMKENCLLIITDRVGLLEQTNNGSLALVASPTSESIYDKLKDAVTNYHEYSSLIECANTYIQKYSWSNLAKRLIDAF